MIRFHHTRNRLPALSARAVLMAALATMALAAVAAPRAAAQAKPTAAPVLAGASDGLYRLDGPLGAPRATRILGGTDVRKIVKAGDAYFLLTGRGVLRSADLASFEERNAGLPIKTLKTFLDGRKGFAKEIQELKDLEADPYDPLTLVTCTKDAVYQTKDGGLSWKSAGSPAPQPGLKAVAVTSRPRPTLFASHAIKGPFAKAGDAAWREIGGELGRSDPAASPDEVSDIVVEARDDGPVVWAANSFLPRLYRYDFGRAAFDLAYAEKADFAAFDSLCPASGLLFVTDGEVRRYTPGAASASQAKSETAAAKAAAAAVGGQLLSLRIPSGTDGAAVGLSELWLVSFKDEKPYRAAADGRHGIYLQTGFVVRPESRAKYDEFLTGRGLDTIVVDLKDDHGRLRYESRDPLVRSIGRSSNPLDVEGFVTEMKAKGRYLVARIVVFKDQRLYEHAGGAYAVWDGREDGPWRGYELEEREEPIPVPEGAPPSTAAPATRRVSARKYYGEYWVDPYCEKVWEYNVAIAREIVARGASGALKL